MTAMEPLLSVIVPTRNEAASIAACLHELQAVLRGLHQPYEVLVVDDASPDGTGAIVARCAEADAAIRLVPRPAAPGLAAAIAAGFDLAQGEWLAVLDADGQHDPAALVPMLVLAREQAAEVVVATRYAPGASLGDWPLWRRLLSQLATAFTRRLLDTRCSDPLSGFFLLHRTAWWQQPPAAPTAGFKLLLDLLVHHPDWRVAEIAYAFRARRAGASKLRAATVFAFVQQLWRLVRERRA